MDVIHRLREALGQDKVFDRPLDRFALASDASFYSLIPLVVVRPDSEEDIATLFRIASETKTPLTFRAAGTSLSGQAISDGILVDISRSWRDIQVLSNGESVKTGPGVVGSWVNDALRPYRRKIGPDPASLSAAMMGGIIANNSSGMCCGVQRNAYHTLRNLVAILPCGFRFSPDSPEDEMRLLREHPEIHHGLLSLRSRILSDETLPAKIRSKYRIKNTVGYSLNAFMDFEKPLDILAHLLVGSEGTLGFIAETTLETIPAPAYALTGLLFFPDVHRAAAAVPSLLSAAAVELMDRASLRSVQEKAGELASAIQNSGDKTAALLIEFTAETAESLEQIRNHFYKEAAELDLLFPARLTDDPKERALLWSLRKGLYPAVGSLRKSGASVLIEDVAVPVEKLAELVVALQTLFVKHGYTEAVIFGHAKDGNIHFVITPSFQTPQEVTRYARLMEDVVTLVSQKYDGSLKGEHGTGRNMAPFVEAEWGSKAVEIMHELKRLLDPMNICNPGVILSEDPEIHIQNLKAMPPVSPELDLCTECGYCESHCPSRDLTTTPRQRIVLQRRMAILEGENKKDLLKSVENAYRYEGTETCATDGLCSLACPMGIDTGKFIKKIRDESHGAMAEGVALSLASNMRSLTGSIRMGLGTARSMSGSIPFLNTAISRAKHLLPGLPLIPEGILPPSPLKPSGSKKPPEFVYFQTCVSRTMGGYPNKKRSLGETLLVLAERAQIVLKLPDNIADHCCGMPFASKGFTDAYRKSLRNSISMLYRESREGTLPIVVDISPCTQTFRNGFSDLDRDMMEKYQKLRFLDSVEFAAGYLLDRLPIVNRKDSVVLHPVCSLRKMGLLDEFQRVARACALQVTIPARSDCCGMAGDRGLMYPELVEAATRLERDEVLLHRYDGYYSSSRTCEYALGKSTGADYHSILYLLEEATSHAD